MKFKPLPIGVEDYKEFYTDNYYYVDKTIMIKKLIDRRSKVNLFTRPRRFGKTLTLSMLKYYFEDERDRKGRTKDNKYLFDETNISKEDSYYQQYMGKYPVISLTLKGGKQNTLESSFERIINEISGEFERHSWILNEDILSLKSKIKYEKFMNEEYEVQDYKGSLQFLSQCLEIAYDNKVIILIDEYDVPLEGAYSNGFYAEMVDFIRELFGSVLKTNKSMYFSVLTGCLRISKESIFTGLNNLDIDSIMTYGFEDCFGFTENEIKKLCKDYEMEDLYDTIKFMYDGYIFGNMNIYNPWSTLKYIKDHIDNHDGFPLSYWANTSSNSIVRDLIIRADDEVKKEIEDLIIGKSIIKPIHEDITYDEVYDSMDNLWNFMYFTGYLKKINESYNIESKLHFAELKIPNGEVEYIFREKITNWFNKKVEESDRRIMFNALVSGNVKLLQNEISKLLRTTISFNDYYENFYHGFLAGIFTGMSGYIIKSNRESGNGRTDIFIKPLSRFEKAFVIEFKMASNIEDIYNKTNVALKQIEDKNYCQELRDDGYTNIGRYGIAFLGKDCVVAYEEG